MKKIALTAIIITIALSFGVSATEKVIVEKPLTLEIVKISIQEDLKELSRNANEDLKLRISDDLEKLMSSISEKKLERPAFAKKHKKLKLAE